MYSLSLSLSFSLSLSLFSEPSQPINQPQRRVVSTSVRQDDDHTITLEATQDMLFMSPEGLPSEGDIAQMTQVERERERERERAAGKLVWDKIMILVW